MILTRRIIPFIAPLFLAGILSGFFFRFQEWRWWVGAIVFLPFITIAFMTNWKWRSAQFWGLLFPLCSSIYGGVGLLFFMGSTNYKLILALLLVVMTGVYLENVFIYQYQAQKYTQLSLPNLTMFLHTFAAFAVGTVGFGLVLIAKVSPLVLTVFLTLFSIALMSHLLWMYHVEDKHRIRSVILVGAFVAELVWVLQYWPTVFFVNGMVVAIFMYAIPSIIHLHLRQQLTKRLWIQYAFMSLILCIIVLSTARWT